MKCSKCGQEFTGNSCPTCGHTKLTKLLVNPDEEEIMACLGNNLAQTFVSTGELGNGFAILSNKRVYFKGKCLIRKGKGFYSRTEERTVDLDDVTGTGFVHNNALWAKILCYCCIALVALGVYAFIGSIVTEEYTPIMLFIFPFGFLALLFHFLAKIHSRSVFEISYAGGSIAFSLYWITMEEAEEFQKNLVLLKQNQKATVPKA